MQVQNLEIKEMKHQKNGKVENEEPVNDERAAGAKLRNEGNEAPENGEVENEEPVNDEPKNTKPLPS